MWPWNLVASELSCDDRASKSHSRMGASLCSHVGGSWNPVWGKPPRCFPGLGARQAVAGRRLLRELQGRRACLHRHLRGQLGARTASITARATARAALSRTSAVPICGSFESSRWPMAAITRFVSKTRIRLTPINQMSVEIACCSAASVALAAARKATACEPVSSTSEDKDWPPASNSTRTWICAACPRVSSAESKRTRTACRSGALRAPGCCVVSKGAAFSILHSPNSSSPSLRGSMWSVTTPKLQESCAPSWLRLTRRRRLRESPVNSHLSAICSSLVNKPANRTC